MRRRFNYANVTASLALFFAMSGGALAAKHYLLNSTKQISPPVLKALKGNRGPAGTTGAGGKEGPQGKEGAQGREGPRGKEGAPGGEGKQGEKGPAGEPASTLLASIQASGAVTHQKGLETVEHTIGSGKYTLIWTKNVSQCYPVGNISAITGFVVMNGISTTNLTINTFNVGKEPTDEAFYVAVLC